MQKRDSLDPFTFIHDSTIADSTMNDGSFEWLIPPTQWPGSDYRVQILEPASLGVNDFSDQTFTITAPAIEVIAPGDGDMWNAGTIRSIVWDTTDLGPSDVRIEITKRDNNIVTTTLVASTPNTRSFAWAIPAGLIPGADYKIRISSILYPAHSAWSEGTFAITEPPGLYVTSPGAGDLWKIGDRRVIRWTEVGMPQDTDVEIDLYEGTEYVSTISTASLLAGIYPWQIPNFQKPGSAYRIKITSKWDPSYFGFSAPYFLIRPVTAVNGQHWPLY